jgi:DNA-binding NarL/FixJ family response regulator
LIMGETNAQWLLARGSLKPRGNYTGKRLSVRKAQAIINALARGEPVTLIARRLRTSHDTVRAMRDREYAEISRRKELIAASAARLAGNGSTGSTPKWTPAI